MPRRVLSTKQANSVITICVITVLSATARLAGCVVPGSGGGIAGGAVSCAAGALVVTGEASGSRLLGVPIQLFYNAAARNSIVFSLPNILCSLLLRA